jgi:uracil-DNA glycosylase
VPSFGPDDAALLVVGLAPGLRGANRTGRPFTGDHAGRILYPALLRHGFATGRYDERPDDGLRLQGCRITNAVRCVPPANRPEAAEVRACGRFLAHELGPGEDGEPAPRVVLCLGRVAHEAVLRALGRRLLRAHPFAHGAELPLAGGPVLLASYHCSRYNINTGRLTEAMLDGVVARARALVDSV